MRRLFPTAMQTLRDSVLLRIGTLMTFLALLSLVSILISTTIAEDISGRASAVNVSGSLRMLSFRTLSELQQPDKREHAIETIQRFERRLSWLERFAATKSSPDAAPNLALRGVLQRWTMQIRPLEMAAAAGDPAALAQAARDIPDFVEQIDHVVRLIEEELESKAKLLRAIQLGLLAAIVAISMLTVWMLRHRLVQPLAQLLEAARTVTQGSFSVRVAHVSNDELGRVGQAFNAMVAEIAAMYGHLEEKVEEKTRELTRTNQSLELLYRVSQQLSASDLTLDKLQAILREVEEALEIGHTMVCVAEHGHFPAQTVVGDLTTEERTRFCGNKDCRQCFASSHRPLAEQAAGQPLVVIPIGDTDGQIGTFPVVLRADGELPVEKARVIETVGHHVSNALVNMRRAEEKHRLAVLEERSVIARELHDSIAQSLSYLKIQVTRLEKSIAHGGDPAGIAQELRDGLNGAYRELRELITTFRLRIDERGFAVALAETVAEFSEKIGAPVELHNTLPAIVLSANEEMHLVRIVREALSNVERHAGASRVGVDIAMDDGRRVTIRISDDGCGFDPTHVPANHFGTAIMHDRSDILDGELAVISASGAGTTVTLTFVPQHYRQPEPA